VFSRNVTRRARWDLVALAALAILTVLAVEWMDRAVVRLDDRAVAAAQKMERATSALSDHRAKAGPPLDPEDIHETGLIGTFLGPLTTTVGTLEAKRTTTNPNMAALAAKLLTEAGVCEGDAIAIGASGSFPAILLAVLCAGDSLDVDVGLIVSFGSSQWGANLIDFTWLDVEDVLIASGLLASEYRAAAVSFGGANDVGFDLAPDVREELRTRAADLGVPLIDESNLAVNVARRMQIYDTALAGRPPSAFVNIGGAWANVGTGTGPLALVPGVNVIESIPPTDERGVLFEYAARGVPVVHFLNIAALATEYELPWDPTPIPTPGEQIDIENSTPVGAAILGAAYIVFSAGWLIALRPRQWRP